MRGFLLTSFLVGAAAFAVAAPAPPRERIAAYFRGWYAHVPGSEIVATPTKEVALPGLESFMVERQAASKSRQESSLVLYDPSADEIFVGDVFGDPERAASGRPFETSRDLPNVEASVRDMFGLPVRVQMGAGARGPLLPLTVTVDLDKAPGASFVRPG